MKYIKKYESQDTLYNDGDYIIISKISSRIRILGDRWNMHPYFCTQIVDVSDDAYYMETFDKENNKDLIFWLKDGDIDRIATKEEIKDFETLRNSIKFNI